MFRLFATLKRVTPLAAFFLLLVAAGCNQDSIFDYISGETAPTKALIQGAPSKIVDATIDGKEKLYIANGRIWEYDPAAASWTPSAGPGGYVVDVAATDGYLYALAIDNTTTTVWQNGGSGWTAVAPPDTYGYIQNIFGAGDALFATGAKRADDAYDYAILSYKQTDSTFSVSGVTGDVLLTGAEKVGGNYYLATRGQGLYSSADGSVITQVATTPSVIVGLLQVKVGEQGAEKDIIIGISRGGFLVRIDSSVITVNETSLGGTYTGAIALMDSPDPQDGYDKLLLLGYKDSNSLYKHGYMELRFKSSDGANDGTPRIPGENQPSSVADYRQYDSSLRRYPVRALRVVPKSEDTPQVIFAATQNQGLYSYRYRPDGDWQWNHEE